MRTGKIMLLAMLWLAAAAAGAYAFDAGGLSLVDIVNRTGSDIEVLFLSPGDSEYWGPELLGTDWVLEADGEIGYFLAHPNGSDPFDIFAVDAEGNSYALYNLELGDGARIVISADCAAEETPEFEFSEISIRNNVLPIEYLFISPADSAMWGVDFLDETTVLASGDSVSFVVPSAGDPVLYDLLAVDEEGATYSFSFQAGAGTSALELTVDPEDAEEDREEAEEAQEAESAEFAEEV